MGPRQTWLCQWLHGTPSLAKHHRRTRYHPEPPPPAQVSPQGRRGGLCAPPTPVERAPAPWPGGDAVTMLYTCDRRPPPCLLPDPTGIRKRTDQPRPHHFPPPNSERRSPPAGQPRCLHAHVQKRTKERRCGAPGRAPHAGHARPLRHPGRSRAKPPHGTSKSCTWEAQPPVAGPSSRLQPVRQEGGR